MVTDDIWFPHYTELIDLTHFSPHLRSSSVQQAGRCLAQALGIKFPLQLVTQLLQNITVSFLNIYRNDRLKCTSVHRDYGVFISDWYLAHGFSRRFQAIKVNSLSLLHVSEWSGVFYSGYPSLYDSASLSVKTSSSGTPTHVASEGMCENALPPKMVHFDTFWVLKAEMLVQTLTLFQNHTKSR